MIKYLDLQAITALHAQEVTKVVTRVVDSGWYLLGKEVLAFESAYKAYIGTPHCIACANGLDALTLILRAYIEIGAIHPGDEIIVPANTYIASILAITENGLTPVLVEPNIDTFQIDADKIAQQITQRTRALMLVHLYGRCAYTKTIADICQRHNLILIEDNAQAHGCHWQNLHTGALGNAAAHSFYPGKNLGALGDAGAVTTHDAQLADVIRALGNYGSSQKYIFDYAGRNSRMDEIQAAVLQVKLKHLDNHNRRRQQIARQYIAHIANPLLTVPTASYLSSNVFHIFPLRCKERSRLQAYLLAQGIETMIHYPLPPHKQQCYKHLHNLSLPITEQIHREELSIPLYPTLKNEEIEYIINRLNAYH